MENEKINWGLVIKRAIGLAPTSFLLRWSPSLKNPVHFDLLELFKCATDGGIVTRRMAQSSRAVEHLGHQLKSPNYFSWWTLFKVQLRIIR